MSNLEPIVQANGYYLSLIPLTSDEWLHWAITVEWRNLDQWAVCHGGHYCCTKSGSWSYERSPSNRSDAWVRTHRFDLETALVIAKRELPKVIVNGKTAADYLARCDERARAATELHRQAIDLADRGDACGAMKLEWQAADMIAKHLEPTRSVLHRSAAQLALDCGEVKWARAYARMGLAGHPPADIKTELEAVAAEAQRLVDSKAKP